MTSSSRALLGRAPEPTPDCTGSGTDTPADDHGTTYQDTVCPTCKRRFTVRIVRTRDRKKLPQPAKTVPRHRAT